ALSHELRTPLTSVLGWSALLTRNPDRDTALEAARAITNSASLQAQLIDDLLDISRMMTGKFDTSKTDVDLHDIVDDTVTSVRPAATAKGLSLQWENTVPILLSADGTRLRQVVSNLLSNAIKFTPAGGLIGISLEREGPDAVIRVQDSGEGIPPQFLPHVFERYAQLGERRHGGMGLGLAIVKHIVELHGGTVSVESAGVGHGALFTVRLPINVDLLSS
ncbi:MAG: HAMP domain-containing sensor histidine kinase, partial [Thermoanaerobaculia bacterium]